MALATVAAPWRPERARAGASSAPVAAGGRRRRRRSRSRLQSRATRPRGRSAPERPPPPSLSSAQPSLSSAPPSLSSSALPSLSSTQPSLSSALHSLSSATMGGEPDKQLSAAAPAQPQRTWRRYLVLLLFTFTSASSAVQWIQFAIITEPVMRFYGVSSDQVNWTSMIYMVTYVPLVFPAAFLLDRMGLRVCVTLGAMGTCAGASLKAFAAERWLWSLAFAGQAITAMSQTCLLGVPARLAAVWFPSTELASATAVGVFGNQLGIAVGFLVPPLVVHNETNVDDIGPQLHVLFSGTAAVTGTLLLLIILLFRAAPPGSPPPPEQPVSLGEFVSGVRRLLTHRNFLLLLAAYALNVGSFYAVSTLLGQAVAARVADSAEHAGILGLVMVVAGMMGSVICGVILDRTRKYKEVTLAVYVMSLVGLILYAGALASRSLGYLYFASISLGFFMTGYLPLGFELAAELTHPEPEGTSSGLLNAGAQLGGLAFTPAYAALLEHAGDLWANAALCAALVLGMGVSVLLLRADLRRQTVLHPPPLDAEPAPAPDKRLSP